MSPVLAGQPALVRTIWSWTSADLGRPDGLFASHASGTGRILDPHSATDADTLIAYALLRFAGPDQAVLHRAGRRVAEGVLALESVTLPDGSLLPVAGPWAKSSSPPIVDPSYLMPGVFVALARLTGDDRWNGAADASITLIEDLTHGGRLLPPDWAQLSGRRLVAIANPGGGTGVQYGFASMPPRPPFRSSPALPPPPPQAIRARRAGSAPGRDTRSRRPDVLRRRLGRSRAGAPRRRGQSVR